MHGQQNNKIKKKRWGLSLKMFIIKEKGADITKGEALDLF